MCGAEVNKTEIGYHWLTLNTIQYNTLKTYIALLYKNVQGRL